jgi:serine/threonine-protein kinase
MLSAVTLDDPPPVISGMIGAIFDHEGRLMRFTAVPPQVESAPAKSNQPDWAPLFTAAGLDLSVFKPADPTWTPLAATDSRAAWEGPDPFGNPAPIRVEAAAWRGKPVYFQVVFPWTMPERVAVGPSSNVSVVAGAILVLVILGLAILGSLVFALALAWRNWRARRADIRGASRLAAFVFACQFLASIMAAHIVPLAAISAARTAALVAAVFWITNVALEPFLRRRWPHTLISWMRLLRGGFRDPLVGGHVLIGAAAGVGFTMLGIAQDLINKKNVVDPSQAAWLTKLTSGFLAEILVAMAFALFGFLVFFTLRAVTVRSWIGAALIVLIFAASGFAVPGSNHLFNSAVLGIVGVLGIACMARWGILTLIVAITISAWMEDCVLTLNFNTWYGTGSAVAMLAVVALTGYEFKMALAGRRLFAEGLLES